ncbi:MAG: outer membrane protein assembly factor BamD [Bacteroidales bacterium OttesenSCG-928-I14]|jgi:outer membrane protein assembly factor BamD|nr:outer membrane protein assembly factor BamD [Bacteroidales bacterium OttesenSCG-928-I14]
MGLKLIHFFFILLLFVSCGEYDKISKTSDIAFKCKIAKNYFNNGKYRRSISILKEVIPLVNGTKYMNESLYLLAESYYKQKDYISASKQFWNYYTMFPGGDHAEIAHFYSAYSLYLMSPDAQFDQFNTYKAIHEFQEFLKKYPNSDKKKNVQCFLCELQEKLAFKELIAVRLYYKLKNYLSCVVTAQNAIQFYPFSKYRENFVFYIFKSKCRIVFHCIKTKNLNINRYRDDIIDEYYSYIDEYPSGENLKCVKKLYDDIIKRLMYYDSKKK